LELDSHADTCLFGRDALLLYQTDESVEVSGFHLSLQKLTNIPIASVAVAYDDPVTCETWMLEFHQVLYSKDLPNGLLCPNQMPDNGITVNDVPRQFATDKRSPTTHALMVGELIIPLEMVGIWSAFEFRTPTMDEWRSSVNKIEVTSPTVRWDPHSGYFASREREYEPLPTYVDRFAKRKVNSLSANVSWEDYERINKARKREAGATATGKRRGIVGAKQLAEKWGVPLDMAERTVEITTQRGVRDFTNVTGTKRLRSLDRQFKYRHIDCTMFADTVQGPCRSINGNLHATVFSTSFGWVMAHGIKSTSEVHTSLDLLHKRTGAPRVMCSDGANVFVGESCEFRRKSRAAGSHTIATEPHTQRHNLAEAGVRELKRKYKKLKRKTNSPKAVWDHLLMYASLILSHTARDITELEGQVPQTLMTGDTSDISKLVEFEWYEWVWFSPSTERLPEKLGKGKKKYLDHETGSDQFLNMELGRYLGPSLEMGEELASKILTQTGHIAVRTSVYPISQQEMDSEDHRRQRDDWSTALREHLRDRFEPSTYDEDDNMYDFVSDYEMAYDGDLDEGEQPAPEADDYDHVTFDKYLHAQVKLPRGDEYLMHKRMTMGTIYSILTAL
jgi:hypothetical protein